MTEIKTTKIPHRQRCINKEHPYTSGARDIYDDEKGKRQSVINQEVDDTFENHQQQLDNKYNKSEVYKKEETYNKTELDNMITTPEIAYKDYDTYADMVAETVHPAGAIYRVANYDGTQAVTNKYAEYSWDGTQYKLMAVRDHGVDAYLTAGSDRFVTSATINNGLNIKNKENYTVKRTPTIYQQKGYYTTQGLSVGDVFPETYVSTAGQSDIIFANCHTNVNKGDFICISGKNVTSYSALYCLINKTTKVILAIFNGQLDNEIVEVPQDDCQIWFCHRVTGSTVSYNFEILSKNDDVLKEKIDINTEDINQLKTNLGTTKEISLNANAYSWQRDLGIFNTGDIINVSVPSDYNGILQINGNDATSEAFVKAYATLNSSKKDVSIKISNDNVFIVLYSSVAVNPCTISTRTMAKVENLTRFDFVPESEELGAFILALISKGVTTVNLKPYGSYRCIGHIFKDFSKRILIEGNNATINSVDSNGDVVIAKASTFYRTNIIIKNATINNMYGVSGGFIELFNCILNYNTGTAVGAYDDVNSLIGTSRANSHFVLENVTISSTVKEHFGITIRDYCEGITIKNITFNSNMLYYFFHATNGLKNSLISNIIANDAIAGIQFSGRSKNVFENNIIENCVLSNIKEEAICFDCFGNEYNTPLKADCSVKEITDTEITLPTSVTIPAKFVKVSARKLNSDLTYSPTYFKNNDEPVIIDGVTVSSINAVGMYFIGNNKAKRYKIYDATNDGTYSYITICANDEDILISQEETEIFDCVLIGGFHNNIIRNCHIESSTTGISLWGACFGNNIESCQAINCKSGLTIVGFNGYRNRYKLYANENVIFNCFSEKISVKSYTEAGIDALVNYRNKLLANIYNTLEVNSQEDFINYDSQV